MVKEKSRTNRNFHIALVLSCVVLILFVILLNSRLGEDFIVGQAIKKPTDIIKQEYFKNYKEIAECKISCGENIISECNDLYTTSYNAIDELLICDRTGVYYIPFEGCKGHNSQECEHCYEDYNEVCGPEAYNLCIASCE